LTDAGELVLLPRKDKKTCKRMSENENQPPTPSSQTSSVPLKKETVRVTLDVGAAPPSVPSATVPMAPPAGPPIPPSAPSPVGGAPRPPAPAPTIPLRTAGAPPISPAPTIRLAPTAAPTAGLPKATVQLQKPAVPLGGPVALQTPEFDADDSEEGGEGLANALSAVGLVAALVVLFFQVKTANTWINAEDSPNKGSWGQIFE